MKQNRQAMSGRTNMVYLVTVILAVMMIAVSSVSSASSTESFVPLINQERSAAGMNTLAVDGELATAARRHSNNMASSGELYHSTDLSNGISNWQLLGENVGVGWSVQSLHDAFMNSSGHRANILQERFTHIGVGVVTESDGRIWVTIMFKQADTAPPPEPAPEPKPRPEPKPDPAPTHKHEAPEPVYPYPDVPALKRSGVITLYDTTIR